MARRRASAQARMYAQRLGRLWGYRRERSRSRKSMVLCAGGLSDLVHGGCHKGIYGLPLTKRRSRGPELKSSVCQMLNARPRHHAQDTDALEGVKRGFSTELEKVRCPPPEWHCDRIFVQTSAHRHENIDSRRRGESRDKSITALA